MMKFPGWWQNQNDGPPDLDQVMRDLSKKINTMFGKTGGKIAFVYYRHRVAGYQCIKPGLK